MHYPNVDDNSLIPFRVLSEQVSAHGIDASLGSSECPYDDDVKSSLREVFSTTTGPAPTSEIVVAPVDLENQDNFQFIQTEVLQLYADLKAFSSQLGPGDSTQMMSSFRTRTQLLERLIKAYQDVMGLKQQSEFMSTVIGVLEGTMTKDQRTEVIQKLKAIANEAVQQMDTSIDLQEED